MTARLIRRCEYCDTILPRGAQQCPSCTSRQWKEEVIRDDVSEVIATPQEKPHLSMVVCFAIFALTICIVAIIALSLNHHGTGVLETSSTTPSPSSTTTINYNTRTVEDIRDALSYSRSVNGNGKTLPSYKNGYYLFGKTIHYNHEGRWFTSEGNAGYGWEYEYMVPAELGNNADKYFVSVDYKEWFADECGVDNIIYTPYFKK